MKAKKLREILERVNDDMEVILLIGDNKNDITYVANVAMPLVTYDWYTNYKGDRTVFVIQGNRLNYSSKNE